MSIPACISVSMRAHPLYDICILITRSVTHTHTHMHNASLSRVNSHQFPSIHSHQFPSIHRPIKPAPHSSLLRVLRQGTHGVSTNGVTATFMMFLDRGTFWVLPLTYFYLPQSARAYLFPQSVNKNITFAADPLV